MAVLKPFKGMRPTPDMASRVAALPYDVLSSNEARVLVKGNEWSFLHVDKSEIDLPPDVDLYDERVYRKARENFDKLVREKVFIQDREACFYIYRQVMNGRAQTGVVGTASVDEYFNETIKKHELTRADKEQDRIRHVEVCDANTGPIFLTYPDKAEITNMVAGWISGHDPVYNFTSEDGIQHIFWVVDDKGVNAGLEAAFKEVKAFYIADGHHRSAAAAKVGRKKKEANGGCAEDAPYNHFLSVAFPAGDLYIMDYNRLVKDLRSYSASEFLAKLGEIFNVEKVSAKEPYRPQKVHQFGLYLGGVWYKLDAKPSIIDSKDPIKSLDVYILQEYVLMPLLGIKDPRTDKRIDFVGGIRGLSELSRRCENGEFKVAFAMFPTSIEQLMSVADAGLCMPPKSTWFEPKLRSGLIIHKLS
ncbi:MAG: DUF1015 domain-containing protein [Oligoflexales bacterium]|nr:DUF1015 domain-containing protein [Oligoflexales bacterium]